MTAACATTPVTEGTPEQKVGWVGNTPYAAMPELESVTNGTNAYVYWRIARLFALCELENFRDDNDWTDMKISERPVLVYDALSHPKYYEYRVLNGGTECGAIVCIAQKKDGEPTAYVLRYAPDYSELLDYPANYRVIADGYPKVGYAPVDGVYAAKSGVRMLEEEVTETVVSNVYGHWETNVTTSYVGGYEEYLTNYNWYSDLIEDTNFYWMTNVSEISAGVWETNIARFSTRWTTNVVLVSSDPEVWETNYQFLDTRYLTNWVCSTNLNSYWTGGETVIESNIYWVEDPMTVYYETNFNDNDPNITNFEIDPLELALLHPEYFTNFNVVPEMVVEAAKQIVESNQVKWDIVDRYFTNLIYYSTNDELIHQKYLETKTKSYNYDGGKVINQFKTTTFKWWDSETVLKYISWKTYGVIPGGEPLWCGPSAVAMMMACYGKLDKLRSIVTNIQMSLDHSPTNAYFDEYYSVAGSSRTSPINAYDFMSEFTFESTDPNCSISSVYLEMPSLNYFCAPATYQYSTITTIGSKYILMLYSRRASAGSDAMVGCTIKVKFYAPNPNHSYGDIKVNGGTKTAGYTIIKSIVKQDMYRTICDKMGMSVIHWGLYTLNKIATAMNWAYGEPEFVYDDTSIGNSSGEGNDNRLWLLIQDAVNKNKPFLLSRTIGIKGVGLPHIRVGFGYKITHDVTIKQSLWWLFGFIPMGEKEAKANLHWVLLTDGNDDEFNQSKRDAAGKITYYRDYKISDHIFWERINWSSDKTLLPAQNYSIVYNKYR